MKIIIRNIIRNILSNKRRTLALILCMTAVAFSAMAAFSVASSAKGTLQAVMRQFFGDSEYSVVNTFANNTELTLPDGTEGLYLYNSSIEVQKRSADNFIYPTKFTYPAVGMNIEAAIKHGFLPTSGELPLGENEVIISEALAKAEELSVGSKIEVVDADKQPFTLTVRHILPNELFLKTKGACLITTRDTVNKLEGEGKLWETCFISGGGEDVYAALCDNNPDFEINSLLTDDGFFEIFALLFGIFLVLALIIFVVTSGISEHIVRERMSQLGTLRSLGATRASAGLSLIAENLFYGLFGSVLGILLYLPLHRVLIDGLTPSAPYVEHDYSIKAYAVLCVLLITALLSCGSSVKAVLRAVKTPIRDVIFGSRNSAYDLHKTRAFIGLAMFAGGAVCGLCVSNLLVIVLSIIAFVVGLIFFMPLLLDLIKNVMRKSKDPMIRFSFINIATKKQTVDNAVMYSAVIGLVSAVLMLVCNIGASVNTLNYSGDIVINFCAAKAENYRFIEALDGVERAELYYSAEDFAEINGRSFEKQTTVVGYGGGLTMYNGVTGLPETVADNEVSLDERLMKKLGIKAGDSVSLTLNAKGERPVTLELTAVKGCNSSVETYGMRNGIVLSLDTYKRYYSDEPAALSVKLRDPSTAVAVKSEISTYLMDKNASIYLYDEYAEFEQSGDESIKFMLAAIIAIGCLLSVILLITNQSIGFEQRRKELAVLHSTSMSKEQLKKMLFRETAFSILISTVAAFVTGIIGYTVMLKFVEAISGTSESVKLFLPQMLGLLAGMYLIALLTTLSGGKRLKKMNTAEQMKYE